MKNDIRKRTSERRSSKSSASCSERPDDGTGEQRSLQVANRGCALDDDNDDDDEIEREEREKVEDKTMKLQLKSRKSCIVTCIPWIGSQGSYVFSGS